MSGEPYITHPVAVARVVAELGLDPVSVAAALLHDAVEDTTVDLAEIEDLFGQAVTAIVDGVTKLDRLRFDSKEAQQAATVRKMLVAMARDWRVLVIKLADRLHNMRTLDAMPEWKQLRTAEETRDIYAPLAHRLGIEEIKWQLEDLAFETLHPKRFAEIAQMVATRAPRREVELAEVLSAVRSRLEELGIDAEVTGRPKHLWSIYEKMVVRGKEFDEIHDLVAIRVVVTTEKDCWAALGSRTTSTRRSSTSTSPCTQVWSGDAANPSRSRSAPRRCTGAPSTASPRTGATRSQDPPIPSSVAPDRRTTSRGSSAWSTGSATLRTPSNSSRP